MKCNNQHCYWCQFETCCHEDEKAYPRATPNQLDCPVSLRSDWESSFYNKHRQIEWKLGKLTFEELRRVEKEIDLIRESRGVVFVSYGHEEGNSECPCNECRYTRTMEEEAEKERYEELGRALMWAAHNYNEINWVTVAEEGTLNTFDVDVSENDVVELLKEWKKHLDDLEKYPHMINNVNYLKFNDVVFEESQKGE